MKAVLISIRPEWCEKIVTGQKTIEVRKTRPKMNPPFKCYIYKCGNGKVIGEFLCDEIININGAGRIPSDAARPTCLKPAELHQYLGAATGFGWHISDLRVYDHPRDRYGKIDRSKEFIVSQSTQSCKLYIPLRTEAERVLENGKE